MTVQVLTAITGHRESSLVAALDRPGTSITVVRRCADLADVLSAAAAGLAEAAVLSADLGRLDRESVGRLQQCGVAVVALTPSGADSGATADDATLRLRRLGVDTVLPADVPADRLVEAVSSAVARRAAGRQVPAAGPDAEWAGGTLLLADPAEAIPLRPVLPVPPLAGAGQGPGGIDPDDRGAGLMIVVWGPAGAPGRTTVAVTLAALLARYAPVLLADADTHGASIAQALGLLDESAGLAAAARAANQGTLDEDRLQALSSEVLPNLRVLTGLPQPKRWPELRPAALEQVWALARRPARFVVVDAGFGLETDEELMFDVAAPRRHAATLSALAAADQVVAVGAGEPVGIQRLLSTLPDLAEAVPPGVPTRVVVTRVRESAVGRPAGELVRRALDRYAGVADPLLLPDEREAFDGAMLAGQAITEFLPAARSVQLLGDLAAEFAGAAGLGRRSTGPAPGRRRRLRGRLAGRASGRGGASGRG